MDFSVLADRLNEKGYSCCGNYIESCDGWTYFETDCKFQSTGEIYHIYVRFRACDSIYFSVHCDELSNTVLAFIYEEIGLIINSFFLNGGINKNEV